MKVALNMEVQYRWISASVSNLIPVDGSNHTSKRILKVVSCAKALCDAFLLVRKCSQRSGGKNGCADA